MRIKTLENIIDSVDPYFILKDLGFAISKDTANNIISHKLTKLDTFPSSYADDTEAIILKEENSLDSLPTGSGSLDTYFSKINGNLLRILPYGYINTDALISLSNDSADSQQSVAHKIFHTTTDASPVFVAGTAIDMLAFYLKGDYTKAFKLFFKYYGAYLKNRIVHEPAYIESALKHVIIKRHNLLNAIVALTMGNTAGRDGIDSQSSYLKDCHKWMDSNGITTLKGFGFCMDSANLYVLLRFIIDNNLTVYDPYTADIPTLINEKDKFVQFAKVPEGSGFATFINSILFKESSEWIVIPYFADFHLVNGFKFINPKTNQAYHTYIDSYKLSYAGIYTLGFNVDFNNTKVRIIENLRESIVLHNYARENLLSNDSNGNVYKCIAVDLNLNKPNNLKSNLGSFKKPIFLYDQNSSLQTIKSIYDSLMLKDYEDSDLYICRYHNYKEDAYVYTYNAFIEDKFKKAISSAVNTTSNGVSLDLKYLLNIFDVNQIAFKQKLFEWLKTNGYSSTLTYMLSLTKDKVDFNSFVIWETCNGYSVEFKDNPADNTLLSNFIIKIDQNILFKNSDEVIHRGRLLMGESGEYPVAFSKRDLLRKSAIENIALRAYTKGASQFSGATDEEENVQMPILFGGGTDKFYKNILTVIRHSINKAPCKYGVLKLGWDEANSVFTAMAWKATPLRFLIKSQNLYPLLSNVDIEDNAVCIETINKDVKACFSTVTPKLVNYKKYAKFLNSGVRDIISYILAVFYRQYLGYNTAPLYVYDSVNARNLIKFVFLALGQIAPYAIPNNDRFIKSKSLFKGLSGYPLYVRCNNVKLLTTTYTEYPYVVFITSEGLNDIELSNEANIFDASYRLSETGYKQVTKFTLNTIERFFKWIFNVNVEEFSLDNQKAETGFQLIEEGKKIFRHLWWDEVNTACDYEYNPSSALKHLLMQMTLKEIYNYISFYPKDTGYFVLRRAMLPEHLVSKVNTVFSVFYRNKLSKQPCEDLLGLNVRLYLFIDKDMFMDILQDVITKDGQPIDEDKFRIFVDKGVVLDVTTQFGGPARVIDRDIAIAEGVFKP